ncbi:hypothetical protein [Croceicoccus mobilis]|uniref:hypothetical protein n=1 Tax=Croceicoccus mobilis TaxID=1703339 RepID=UPI0012E7C317|nr:hypothetical protein [Croceicoccus mobilis]
MNIRAASFRSLAAHPLQHGLQGACAAFRGMGSMRRVNPRTLTQPTETAKKTGLSGRRDKVKNTFPLTLSPYVQAHHAMNASPPFSLLRKYR